MPKKSKKTGNPNVHDELKGFDIKINEFGEITSNMAIDKLNTFLDDKVDDKKLRDRDDLKNEEE